MSQGHSRDSATRRRILARKAALASIAGLAGIGGAGVGACAHEPETHTVTVEPVATSSTGASHAVASNTASASPTTTATHRPLPNDEDDDGIDRRVVHQPMHGYDPAGPPPVRPPPVAWPTLLGKVTVTSKAQLFRGKRIVEITIRLAPPLHRNDQRVEQNVTGGVIVKATMLRDDGATQIMTLWVEPSPGTDPVHITLGIVATPTYQWGHAYLEAPAARSGAIGQSLPGKAVRLDN